METIQQPSIPAVESRPEPAEDATSKSHAASVSENKSNWATTVATRVLSAEDKHDWATSIAARVLSTPESAETQDRPQSSLAVTATSRVVSIASGKSIILQYRVRANKFQTSHSLNLDLQVLAIYRSAGPGLPSPCATVHCHHFQSRSTAAWRSSMRSSRKHSRLCIPLSHQQDNPQRLSPSSHHFEHL